MAYTAYATALAGRNGHVESSDGTLKPGQHVFATMSPPAHPPDSYPMPTTIQLSDITITTDIPNDAPHVIARTMDVYGVYVNPMPNLDFGDVEVGFAGITKVIGAPTFGLNNTPLPDYSFAAQGQPAFSTSGNADGTWNVTFAPEVKGLVSAQVVVGSPVCTWGGRFSVQGAGIQ